MTMRSEQSATNYTPSSPLSPSLRPSAQPGQSRSVAGNRRQNGLHLPLPRFHPAVYQSPNTSNMNSPTRMHPPSSGPRSPRPIQAHQRQFSNAQSKLYQHQRDLLMTATRNAPFTTGTSPKGETPKAPALLPAGSPGPPTPMMLEEQHDYMTAGRAFGEGSSRDMVDDMIRFEQERSIGLHSAPTSPAVSPAGGRG